MDSNETYNYSNNENLEEIVKSYRKFDGNQKKAAEHLNMSRTTYRRRLQKAFKLGLFDKEQLEIFKLKQQVKELSTQLNNSLKNELKTQQVREHIFNLADTEPEEIYDWFELDHAKKDLTTSMGVPSLSLGDFHWGGNSRSRTS